MSRSREVFKQAGEDQPVSVVLGLSVVGGSVDASDVADLHVGVLRSSDDCSPSLIRGAGPSTGHETDEDSDRALAFDRSLKMDYLLHQSRERLGSLAGCGAGSAVRRAVHGKPPRLHLVRCHHHRPELRLPRRGVSSCDEA